MARIRITVTQEDIDNGIRGSSYHCPIALAAHRVKGFEHAILGRNWARWSGHRDAYELHNDELFLPVSASVSTFIRSFDFMGPTAVKPSTFYIRQ